MPDEIVGIKINVDQGNSGETVGELRENLAAAVNSAKAIGEQFGQSSQEFKTAQANVSAVSKALQEASKNAASLGNSVAGVEAPVKSMRARLKEATQELVAIQEQFGEVSPEALKAAKNVAQLKDQIQDAQEVSALFDPGKTFQSIVGVTGAITAGFSAAQGAMALFGTQSKEVEAALLKVQAAMALSQGLSTLKDSYKDFQRLGAIIQSTTVYQKLYDFVQTGNIKTQKVATAATGGNVAALEGNAAALAANTVATEATAVATGVATTAVKVFRAALITTGIGAIVVLIGYLIGKITEWASSSEDAAEKEKKLDDVLNGEIETISKLIAEQEKLRNARSKFDNYGTAGLDTLQRELTLLKARGATSAEIFNKEQEIRAAERQNLKIQGQAWADFYNTINHLGLTTAKGNADIRDKITDINKQGQDKDAEIEAARTENARAEQKKRDDLALNNLNRLEKITSDSARLKAKAGEEDTAAFAVQQSFTKKRIALLAETLNHDRNDAGAREALLNEQSKLTDATLTKEAERRKAVLDIKKQVAQEEYGLSHTALEKELNDLKVKFDDRIKVYKNAGKDTTDLVTMQAKEEADIRKKYRIQAGEEESQALVAHIDELSQYTDRGQQAILDNTRSTELQKAEAEASIQQQRLEELQRFHAQILTDTTLNADQRAEVVAKYEQTATQIQDAQSAARRAIATAEKNQRIQEAQAVAGALDSFAALAGEQTKAGKVLAVASATISMILSAQQSFTALSGIPIVGPVLGAIAAAGAIAAGIVNIKKILSVQVPGASGGGGSVPNVTAPVAPSLNVQNTNTQLNQDSINAMNNATVKAIVVESDITDSQERISRFHNTATLA